MIGNYEEIHLIKDLLRESLQGLSITEISRQLHLHRTTAAKYLDMLQMKGDVDLRIMGTSKIYHLSRRVPAAVLRNFYDGPFILFTARLTVREFSSELSDYGIIGDITGKEPTDEELSPLIDTRMHDLLKQAVLGTPSDTEFTTQGKKIRISLHIRIIPIVFDDGRAGCALLIHDMTELTIARTEVEICEKELKKISEDLTNLYSACRMGFKEGKPCFLLRMDRKPEELIGFPYEPVISREDLERLSKRSRR